MVHVAGAPWAWLALVLSLGSTVGLAGSEVVWKRPIEGELLSAWGVSDLQSVLVRHRTGLSLLDARDGKVTWSEALADPVAEPVFLSGVDLYIHPQRKETLVLHAASRQRFVLAGRLLSPIVAYSRNDILAFVPPDNLALYSSTDGTSLWSTKLRAKLKRIIKYIISPSAPGCLVYALAEDEDVAVLAMVDLESSKLLWQASVLGVQGVGLGRPDPFTADGANIVTTPDHLYLEMNGLAKIDIRTGRTL